MELGPFEEKEEKGNLKNGEPDSNPHSPSKSDIICQKITDAQRERKQARLEMELKTILLRVELHYSKFAVAFEVDSDEERQAQEAQDLDSDSALTASAIALGDQRQKTKFELSAANSKKLTDEYIAHFFMNTTQLV